MEKERFTLSERETYVPGPGRKFLWWLATAEPELLQDCVVDRNRYTIVGFSVLGTWIFATLAWTYFFSTVVSSMIASVILGIFMGWIILTIDRALIKGISATNRSKIAPLIFRGLLAATIGTFMAQPALLYLFNKEVQVQISLDNQTKRLTKQQQLDSLFSKQKKELELAKTTEQQNLQRKYSEVQGARADFIAETDGTGGTGKIGYATIAKEKQTQYQKLDSDYVRTVAEAQPRLRSIDSSLNAINLQKQQDQAAFETLFNDGFLTRIQALENLKKDNSALQFRYYLLVMILLLIELMPVIAKSFLPNGSYDEKIRLKEELERSVALSNKMHDEELLRIYNNLAFDQNKAFIETLFHETQNEREIHIREQVDKWKKGPSAFDEFWNFFKRNRLAKQES
jgi:hypothetical protein